MSETLSYRVARLLSGSLHAILDKAEDLAPEAALNEHLRQVEQAIDDVRSTLGKTIAQKHLATKKMAEENAHHHHLNDSIQTAIVTNRDDLAQVGIAKQLDIEARLVTLQNTIADCVVQEKELENSVLALQAKRQEMLGAISELKALKTQSHFDTHSGSTNMQIAQNVSKSSHAFDRIMARQTGLNLAGQDTAKLASLNELEALGRSQCIAQRLAKLKANT